MSKTQNPQPATGATFAKGVTASSVIDAIKARQKNDLEAFDAQWEEARQLGHVHRFAEANKKATGRTIADYLSPIAQATGVALKTLQNRSKEGSRLLSAKGLTKAVRDKLRKQLEAEGKKVSVRNVILLHTGGKVEKKSTEKKEDETPTNDPGTVRTTVDAKAPGSTTPATANMSDDPNTASLEWLQLGMKAAKACNTEWADWLKFAGLQIAETVKA